jgi:hypothetical protein
MSRPLQPSREKQTALWMREKQEEEQKAKNT